MKFDMGEAWNQATAMLSANRDLVVVVAGVFFFLPLLVLSLTLPDATANLPTDPEAQQAALLAALNELVTDYWWAFLLAEIVLGMGVLALLALLRDSARPTLGEALKLGALAVASYMITRIILSLTMLVVLLLVAAIGGATGIYSVALLFTGLAFGVVAYLLTRFSLAVPTLGIERVYNPVAALLRSWKLTQGNALRLFAFYFLIGVCTFVIYLVITIVLGMLFAALGAEAQAILGGLLGSLLAAVILSLVVAVGAAAHRQLSGGAKTAR